MFRHVLVTNEAGLLASLKESIVDPADKRAEEILKIKRELFAQIDDDIRAKKQPVEKWDLETPRDLEEEEAQITARVYHKQHMKYLSHGDSRCRKV